MIKHVIICFLSSVEFEVLDDYGQNFVQLRLWRVPVFLEDDVGINQTCPKSKWRLYRFSQARPSQWTCNKTYKRFSFQDFKLHSVSDGPFSNMSFHFLSSLLQLLPLVPVAFATLTTTGDLVISNADVSPDGFSRTATLAGGTVVGELVTGNIVSAKSDLPDELITYFTSLGR